MLDLINNTRRQKKLPALEMRMDLTHVATRWCETMRARKKMSHNRSAGREMAGWSMWAENVGYTSGDINDMHTALTVSSKHRVNILGKDFTEVGIGWAKDGQGVTWWCINFRRPL